jgi:hypothetical protein
MDVQANRMMRWIASEVCDRSIENIEELRPSSEAELQVLYRFSKRQDLAHLVGNALFRYQMFPEGSAWTEKFKKQIFLAHIRYEQIQLTLEALCQAMEQEEIPFMPLKGAVLRQRYPEPWMRTSCDIDVLVRSEDLERASLLLEERLSCRKEELGSHDLSLFASNGVHIELHYDLVENDLIAQSDSVLRTVWEHVTVRSGWRYWYEMSDEMFYFYHIAHMAKHFEIGGCGVRPLIDLWLLEHRMEYSQHDRDELLERGGLLAFANACRSLSDAWFSSEEMDALSKQMQEYILCGGVYGSDENRVAAQQAKQGGKVSYAMSRIFLKYDVLKFHYPVLMKHKWLLPVMEVRRWGKLIFCGGLKRSAKELTVNQTMSKGTSDFTKNLMKQIGLL